MNLPLITLTLVLALIMARRIGHLRIAIWQAMALGAVVVLLTGQMMPADAVKAIDLDVMIFLFGMFIIGHALADSGYLYHLSYQLFSRTKSTHTLVLMMLFGMGGISALLMNDTLAIIGTPLAIQLAREHNMNPKLLLLTLAFAVTLGSVPSPVGNPQNLLIAMHGGFENPFTVFFVHLALPTAINLMAAYLVLRVMFRKEFHSIPLVHNTVTLPDSGLAGLAKLSLVIVIVLIVVKMLLVTLNAPFDFKLSYIALAGALPLLLFSPRRLKLLREIDWSTLIFFAAMFVLMESVWRTGFFQALIDSSGIDIGSVPAVLGISIALSQLISNVPLVALYLPVLNHAAADSPAMLALAAGSTIAGNMLILGAASNVIIIQNAERRGATLGFFEFARVGVPLTLINVGIYWLFLG